MLLFNSRLNLFAGKLKSKWLGPFVVSSEYPSRSIKLEKHEKKRFVMNRKRLNHYHMDWPGELRLNCLILRKPSDKK